MAARQGTLTHFLASASSTAATLAAANTAAAAMDTDEPAPLPAATGPSRRIPRACKQASEQPAPKRSKVGSKGVPTLAAAASGDSCCSHGSSGGASHSHASTEDDEEEEKPSAGDTHHCGVCEGRGVLLLCDGPCGRGFHAACMPECPDDDQADTPWFCVECRDKEHECFICHQTGVDNEDVFLCSAALCGKFYHIDCIKDKPLSRLTLSKDGLRVESFLCPRHRCATCSEPAKQAKHLMCLRCTTTFHIKRCMPNAGVYEFIDGDYMLCNTDMETLNATTDRSDEDTDPAVLEALNSMSTLSAKDDDEPAAQAASPGAAAAAEQRVAKIPAFNPFAIISSSPASAGASSSSSSSAASSSSSFASASSASPFSPAAAVSSFFPSILWQPPTEVRDFRVGKDLMAEAKVFLQAKTPPYFKRVAANQYGSFVQKPNFKVDQEPCTCAENKDKCEENCINRALYVECSRKCPNGEECRNQRISRREYAKTAVVLTEERGWGLIAKEDLPANALVIEYCGEMIDDDECTRRLNETEVTGKKDYYFFKLGNDLVIDAGPIGNNARFLNHSCSPNCRTEMWQIGCQQRVGIFTLQPVPKGTELTYDYNFEGFWQPGAALKCACGSANCAGTLGGKKKNKDEVDSASAAASSAAGGKKGAAKSAAAAAAAAKSAAARKAAETRRRNAEAAALEAASKPTTLELAYAPPKPRAPPTDRSARAASAAGGKAVQVMSRTSSVTGEHKDGNDMEDTSAASRTQQYTQAHAINAEDEEDERKEGGQ